MEQGGNMATWSLCVHYSFHTHVLSTDCVPQPVVGGHRRYVAPLFQILPPMSHGHLHSGCIYVLIGFRTSEVGFRPILIKCDLLLKGLHEVTGTSRWNPGFPASTQERPRESFFTLSQLTPLKEMELAANPSWCPPQGQVTMSMHIYVFNMFQATIIIFQIIVYKII